MRGDGGKLPRPTTLGGNPGLKATVLASGHMHAAPSEGTQLCLFRVASHRPWRIYRQCRMSHPLNNDALATMSLLNEVVWWIRKNYSEEN